jgi:hypothetical protein
MGVADVGDGVERVRVLSELGHAITIGPRVGGTSYGWGNETLTTWD